MPPNDRKGFHQGAATALAILARDFDMPTMAAEIAAEMGLTLADLRTAEVPAYDLAPLRAALAKS